MSNGTFIVSLYLKKFYPKIFRDMVKRFLLRCIFKIRIKIVLMIFLSAL
jgi:hypothetical protein